MVIIEMIFPRGSTGKNGNRTQTDLFLHMNGRKKEWKKVVPDKQENDASNQGKDIYFLGENEYLKITKTAKNNGKVFVDACRFKIDNQGKIKEEIKMNVRDVIALGVKIK